MRTLRWLLIFLTLPLAVWAASAPDIVLKDFNGKDVNVNQYIGKGKWVVVAIWAHDCHICNEEIHEMTAFHKTHKDKDAIVLGVTIDGIDQKKLAQGFIDKHKLPFDNLIAEPDQAVLMGFGGGAFVGTPTYYVYTPQGEIAAKNVGPVSQADIEGFIKEYKAEADGKKG
jgi:peroxiredoxin